MPFCNTFEDFEPASTQYLTIKHHRLQSQQQTWETPRPQQRLNPSQASVEDAAARKMALLQERQKLREE
jgi:hypothetical protein